MPINPLIALQTRVPDIAPAVNQLVDGIEKGRERKERNRLLELSGADNAAFNEGQVNKFKSVYQAALQLEPFIKSGDTQGALSYLNTRREALKKAGIETSHTDSAIQALQQDPTGKLLGQQVSGIIGMAPKMLGDLSKTPLGVREFEGMTQGLSKEDREKARRIELGLDPRAVGSSAITTATTGLTGKVAGSEAAIAGAKSGASERAELDAQLEKLPGVKAAVTQAEERIKNEVEAESLTKKNKIALETYETAISTLEQAFSNAETGPVAGRLPAVTTDAQIAEGTISAMAPILKSVFRIAGEGIFTDKDQELLLNMLPTRKDTPEAVRSKIQNVNAIVRSKLGQSAVSQSTGQSVGRFQVEELP